MASTAAGGGPGPAARGGQHRHVTQTSLQPGADPVKQLAREPYLGPALKPCRQLVDDCDDMLGVLAERRLENVPFVEMALIGESDGESCGRVVVWSCGRASRRRGPARPISSSWSLAHWEVAAA